MARFKWVKVVDGVYTIKGDLRPLVKLSIKEEKKSYEQESYF